MKRVLLLIFMNLILVLLQASFLAEFLGGSLNPNLVVSLAYAFALADDDTSASLSMFIGSFFLDLQGTSIVGLSILFFVLILHLSILLRKTIFKGYGTQILFIFLSTVIYKMLISGFDFSLNFSLVFSGVITAVLAAVMAYFIRRFQIRYVSTEYRIRA